MSEMQSEGWRDPDNLTKWTIWLLYVQVVVAVVAVIGDILEYQLLVAIEEGAYRSSEIMQAAAEASDSRQATIGGLGLIVFIVGGFLILRWIHRANYNSRQLGATQMVFTPGWSIGWYFVPIAFLWKPYQAMKEIWQTSVNPHNWMTQPIPPLLKWWWFAFLVTVYTGNVASRAAGLDDDYFFSNGTMMISDLALIPASLVLISVIRRVHAMQTERRADR